MQPGVTVNRSGDGAAATAAESAAEGTGHAAGMPGSRSRTPDLRQEAEQSTQRKAPNARRRAMPETSREHGGTHRVRKRRTIRNARRLVRNPEYRTMPATCRKSRKEARGIRRKSTCRKWRTWKAQPLFAVCDALGVACCQIRAVSNYVGEPFGQWAVEEAVGNLTEKLNQIFESNE